VLVPAPAADAPKADAEKIAQLVKQLGSDSFDDREKATKELEAIGAAAVPALREAAKNGEAEVKTRAEALIQKVEAKAAKEKILAPTKVKLTFKETPLADAIAEFNKKSGYTIQLHDPDKKTKDRKVTLDTGEVTFWEAFDKFCEKAGLVEATWQDMMPKPVGPGGPGGGILPPPPPINVPKDLKVAPPTPPAKDEAPPPEKKEKKDEGAKGAATGAAVVAAQVVVPAQAGGGGVAGVGGVAAPAIAVRPGFGFGMGPGVITVVDGKPKTVPTCYSGSVRIRALKEGPNMGVGIGILPVPPGGAPGGAKADVTTVWLEVRAEPKVQLQFIQSVALDKATDDQNQKLEKFDPPAPVPGGLPGIGGPGGVGFGGAGGAPAPAIAPIRPIGGFGGFGGGMPGFGGTQNFPVSLKKGEKEAKALKEFAGTLTAQAVPPAEPLITVEKITKASGETAKGKEKDGGQIKVTDVKEEDGKITIQFELEQPQNVVPANVGNGPIGGPIGIPNGPPIKGVPVPLPAPLPPAPATPPPAAAGAGFAFQAQAQAAPAQVQIQIVPAPPAGGGAVPPGVGPIGGPVGRPFVFPAPGITLVDDKGKTITQTGGAAPKYQFVPGGPAKVEFTQEYKLEKDQKPAKLVFSGSKMGPVEIPFSFKDVPLK
jgi:hypothetical protein